MAHDIGHGRGAAYGATLVNLLRFSGYQTTSEYYVNDAGRQMAILTLSVWLRGMQQTHSELIYPERCYQGDYIKDLAAESSLPVWKEGNCVELMAKDLSSKAEEQVDQAIERLKKGVGEKEFHDLQMHISKAMVKLIQSQLQRFKVFMDNWFSETSLVESGMVSQTLEKLASQDLVYKKDGAKWFVSSKFGDEKDRVVVRDNGSFTYFATDIAYHDDKCRRGFDRLINIFGSDHHGYLERLRASLSALGHDKNKLEFIINQLAILWQGDKKLTLSTRAGVFVELDELFDMVGVDAARFMYLTQRHDQHLEFDLQLAASQSRDNPVYYVNYAYARAGQIHLQAEKAGLHYAYEKALDELEGLQDARELALVAKLAAFPELVERSAERLTPHSITQYLRDVAGLFHNYYAAVRVLDTQGPYQARLALCMAVRQVLANALGLMNIEPPEQM